MSTMSLGVVRNNEELVSHNIWSIFQKTLQESVVTHLAALRVSLFCSTHIWTSSTIYY